MRDFVNIDRATLEQLVGALAMADNISLVGSAYTPKAIDTGVREIRDAIAVGRAALAKAEPTDSYDLAKRADNGGQP